MEPAETPDIDALVAELRARVEERRRSGLYPPGFEEEVATIYAGVLSRRGRQLPDLTEAIAAVNASGFDPARIPVSSARPAGEVVHKAVARLVGRQIDGVLEQMRDFAEAVHQAMEEIAEAYGALHTEVTDRLDGVYERQAAQERAIVQGTAPFGARPPGGVGALPAWLSAERLEEECRGPRPETLERYRDVASRLVGFDPVLDVAAGRGELLQLLGELGVAARGFEPDAALVGLAAEAGLPAHVGATVPSVEEIDDASLGALVMLRTVERLTPAELIKLVALAARKVRPGGCALFEAVNPGSLGGWAHPALRDPAVVQVVPPGRLSFLLREAGFNAVDLEWRPGARGVPEEQAAPGGREAYLVTASR
jgi:SAM-dependent methyltransferase